MTDIKATLEMLSGRSMSERARISAYLLAPGLVLSLTLANTVGDFHTLNAAQPVVVSELKTKISSTGEIRRQPGFALIIEPVASEFRIDLESQRPQVWSSLDKQAAHANRSRFTLDGHGLSGKSPFLGIADPVTVVVEGQLAGKIQMPGGTKDMSEFMLQSKRSISIVIDALLACVFAFGMAVATGFGFVDSNKQTAR
jgi:hypothetical protein